MSGTDVRLGAPDGGQPCWIVRTISADPLSRPWGAKKTSCPFLTRSPGTKSKGSSSSRLRPLWLRKRPSEGESGKDSREIGLPAPACQPHQAGCSCPLPDRRIFRDLPFLLVFQMPCVHLLQRPVCLATLGCEWDFTSVCLSLRRKSPPLKSYAFVSLRAGMCLSFLGKESM